MVSLIGAINPADFEAVARLGVQFVVVGLLVSSIPILVGMSIGIVYKVIGKGG